jgi:hypothetical protein
LQSQMGFPTLQAARHCRRHDSRHYCRVTTDVNSAMHHLKESRMKTLSPVLILAILLMAIPGGLRAQTRKYDNKSGIITFEQTSTMGKMKVQEKIVVSFDDYGMRECRESFDGDVVKEIFFSDGKTLYTVMPAQKTAYKRGEASRGTELRFDWDEISAKDKADGKAKKCGNVTVAGKPCESFEVTSSAGKMTFAGWNHITLLTDMDGNQMKSVTRAVKVDENARIPAEKFKVPAGFKVE